VLTVGVDPLPGTVPVGTTIGTFVLKMLEGSGVVGGLIDGNGVSSAIIKGDFVAWLPP